MKRHFISLLFLFGSFSAFGQWQQVKVYPSLPTDGALSFSSGSYGFVGGGLSNSTFYKYDPATDTWTRLANIPSPGDHLGWAFGFSINGKGYVGGGSYSSASDLTDAFNEYDPETNTWSKKASFPGGARDGCFAFSMNGKGYVGGGFDGTYLLNDFYEYDPAGDKWTQLADFPGGAVIFAASFVISNKAYVGIGGQSNDEIIGLWEYDAAGTKWTKKADFTGHKRQASVSFSVNGKGYIGGGMSAYQDILQDFWEYDPGNDAWKDLKADFPSKSIAWSTAFAIGNNAYVGMGTDLPDFNFTNKFYKYPFSTATGIVNENEVEFLLYPNPGSGKVFISGISGKPLTIAVVDVLGRTMFRGNVTAENPCLDLSGLAAGVYKVLISSEGGACMKTIIRN